MKLSEVRAQNQQQAAPQRLKLSQIRAQAEPEQAAPVIEPPAAESRDDMLRRKAREDLAASMGLGEQMVVAADYNIESLGSAIKQGVLHTLADNPLSRATKAILPEKYKGNADIIANAVRPTMDEYDAQLAEEEQRYQEGVGSTWGGKIGGFLGSTAATLPLGGPAGRVGGSILGNALRTGAVSGAVGAATTPVTDPEAQKDFAGAKARQFGLGAVAGGGLSAAAGGLGKVAEEIGLGNLVRRGYNALASRANAKPAAAEGEALAKKYGVGLTPGQVSGGKGQLAVENLARQSIFTRDAVFDTDMRIADEFGKAIETNLAKLAKEGGTTAEAGAAVKDSVDKTLDRLTKRRARVAEADFGDVDKLAAGAPAIKPDRYRETLQRIIDENSVAPDGSDAAALAGAAEKLLAKSDTNAVAKNAIQTRRYLSQISGGQNSFAGTAGQPTQRRAAVQLLKALDDDIEAATTQGGALGEALKKANDRYRAYSQKIEGVKSGPVGKILGKDLVDVEGKGFSSVAPEQIYEKFSKLPPQHIGVAMKVLSPEAQQQVKRAYVQKALEAAQMPTASGGATQASVRPTTFVATLQKTPEDKRRIAALFSPDERKELDELMNLGRRIGDRTGANTSETAIAAQTMGIMEKLRSLSVRSLGEVAGAALGTREIARVMADNNGRRALLKLRRLPPSSAEAKKLASYIGGLAAAREGDE